MTHARGFTLVEAVVAFSVLLTLLAGVAQLFTHAAVTARDARRAPVLLAAASAKLEQLRALTWSVEPDGTPLSDTSSDTARLPPAPAGGTGLSASPAGSLLADQPGWVEYLDAQGRSLGGGSPPAGSLLVRRWAVRPLASDPDVLVLEACADSLRPSDPGRPATPVCLATLRARR